jgi:hypothetical protein
LARLPQKTGHEKTLARLPLSCLSFLSLKKDKKIDTTTRVEKKTARRLIAHHRVRDVQDRGKRGQGGQNRKNQAV